MFSRIFPLFIGYLSIKKHYYNPCHFFVFRIF